MENYVRLKTLGISAPRLEELTFLPRQPDHIDVDGELPCVESMKVVNLYTHRDEDDSEDEYAWQQQQQQQHLPTQLLYVAHMPWGVSHSNNGNKHPKYTLWYDSQLLENQT